MTGIFVRVQDDSGRFVNKEIDELTDSELSRLVEDRSDSGWNWVVALARWIRDNVKEQPC